MAWRLSCTWLSEMCRPNGVIYRASMYDRGTGWALMADARGAAAAMFHENYREHWRCTVVPGSCWLVSTVPGTTRPDDHSKIFIYRLVWVKP